MCSPLFTAQPGNVRQEQALATEGETEKIPGLWMKGLWVCVCQTEKSGAVMVSDANTVVLVNYIIWYMIIIFMFIFAFTRYPKG